MPLYNILYSKKPEDEFSYTGELNESQLNYYKDYFIKTAIDTNNIAVDAANEAIKLSLYNDDLSNDEQYNVIDNNYYYQLHKVLNILKKKPLISLIIIFILMNIIHYTKIMILKD